MIDQALDELSTGAALPKQVDLVENEQIGRGELLRDHGLLLGRRGSCATTTAAAAASDSAAVAAACGLRVGGRSCGIVNLGVAGQATSYGGCVSNRDDAITRRSPSNSGSRSVVRHGAGSAMPVVSMSKRSRSVRR